MNIRETHKNYKEWGIPARQAPLSVGFPRQEYWSRLPFPSAGDLPDPGMEPMSPALQVDSLPLSHLGGALVIPKPGPCVLCYFIWY